MNINNVTSSQKTRKGHQGDFDVFLHDVVFPIDRHSCVARSTERSTVKIHRRVFFSCSRVTVCNFSGFVNISFETFLEKLSPLSEIRNYGDR